MGAFVVTKKLISVPFKAFSDILGQKMISELTAIPLEHLVPVLDAIEDPRVFSQAEIRSVLEEEGHAYATSFFQQLGLVTSHIKDRTVPLDLLHPDSKVHHATYPNQEGTRTITRSTAISCRGCYTGRSTTRHNTKGVGQESSLSYLSAGRCPLTTLWESLESSSMQDGAHPAVMPDEYWV